MEYYYDPAGNRQSVVQTDAQQNIGTAGDQSVTTWYNSNPSTKDYVPDPLNRSTQPVEYELDQFNRVKCNAPNSRLARVN